MHDDLSGRGVWPASYSGRAIIGDTYRDSVAGLSIEDNLKKNDQAIKLGEDSRRVVWAYDFPLVSSFNIG